MFLIRIGIHNEPNPNPNLSKPLDPNPYKIIPYGLEPLVLEITLEDTFISEVGRGFTVGNVKHDKFTKPYSRAHNQSQQL